jgi:PQQ-dependent catabolism-associated beta-propeller protein
MLISALIRRLTALTLILTTGNVAADTAYVSLEDERAVAVVSIPEGKLLKRIPVGKRPRGIGLDGTGHKLLVAVSDEDTIKAFDLPFTQAHGGTKLPSGKDPETFAASPDGHQLFVSNENDNAVTVIDLMHHKAIKSIPVGIEPEGIATSPNGRWVASTSETTNMVHWIDREKLDVLDNTLVDPRPRACQFSHDSEELWVSSEIAGTVTVLDVATRAKKATISFQIPGVTREKVQPVGIQIDRQRQFAYVALGPSNRVAVVDAKTFKVIEYLLVGQRVWNIAFDSKENHLITANGNSNDISIIDLASRKVLRSVGVGQGPWGVVVTP